MIERPSPGPAGRTFWKDNPKDVRPASSTQYFVIFLSISEAVLLAVLDIHAY